MRVGIDMYYAQHQVAFDGIGNYAFSHIAHLSEHPDIQLYHFQPDYRDLTKEEYQSQLSNFIAENQLDIFHFPSPMQVPFPEVILLDQLPKVRLTALVHDIIPLIYPDVYLPDKKSNLLYHLQLLMLKKFDHLFTNSKFTRKDLIRIGFIPEYITTVGVGCQDFFVLEQADLQEMRYLFPIDKPYVLAFNPADFRKNAERIIQAFARAVQEYHHDADVQLLFVNHLPDAVREKFDRISAECGIADRVYYAGRISKSQLLRLYNRAQGVVFPSLYEGVGLPALEAMQCGTPVLTSNTSSMPEIVGDAAIQVDPNDVNRIAQGLVELISNAALRNKLVERGFRQAARFHWKAVAYRTAAEFRKMIKQAPGLKSIMDFSFVNKDLEDVLHLLNLNLDGTHDQDKKSLTHGQDKESLTHDQDIESLLNELRSDITKHVANLYQYINQMFKKMRTRKKRKRPPMTSPARRLHKQSAKFGNRSGIRSKLSRNPSRRPRMKRRGDQRKRRKILKPTG